MAIEYYDDRVQISHQLKEDECRNVNDFLKANPEKTLRLYWFEDTRELDFLKNIPDVKKVSINYSSLATLDFIAPLTNIESLDISEMQGNIVVNAIQHLEKLKVLNLSLTKATRQTDLSILSNTTQLEEFYFSGKFKKNSLDLNVLKNVRILAPQLNTINFQELGSLDKLKEIRLFRQKVATLEGIERLTSVEKVFIYDMRSSHQDILSALFRLPKLMELGLSYVKVIEDFTFIKEKHPLKYLILWTLNGLKSYKGIHKLASLHKLSHCGPHKTPNDIDLSEIGLLNELKELEIKIGEVNLETEKQIEKLKKKTDNEYI